jgi:hypothetical protein
VLYAWILVKASLVPGERDRERRARGDAENRARIGVEATRKIQRHDRRGRRLDRGDGVGVAAGDRAIKACPKEPIHDERRAPQHLAERCCGFGGKLERVDAELA